MDEPYFVDVNNLNIKKEFDYEETDIKMEPFQDCEDKDINIKNELDYEDMDIKMEPSHKNEYIDNMTDCENAKFSIEGIKKELYKGINTIQEDLNYEDVTIKEEKLNLKDVKKISIKDNLDGNNITHKNSVLFISEDVSMKKNFMKQENNSDDILISSLGKPSHEKFNHIKRNLDKDNEVSRSAIQNFERLFNLKHQDSSESLNANVSPGRGLENSDEKSFKCNFCEYTAIRKSCLTRHIKTHTGHRPFSCIYCSYTAARKAHLNIHINTHTGIKPLKCSFCEFSTSNRSHLNRHIRIHTGERPYECNLCEYKASRKSHLTTHVRTHTGEKPHECSFCDFKAADKSSLRRHVKIHTKEKNFKCSFCDYAVSKKVHLERHLRIHAKSLEGNEPS